MYHICFAVNFGAGRVSILVRLVECRFFSLSCRWVYEDFFSEALGMLLIVLWGLTDALPVKLGRLVCERQAFCRKSGRGFVLLCTSLNWGAKAVLRWRVFISSWISDNFSRVRWGRC